MHPRRTPFYVQTFGGLVISGPNGAAKFRTRKTASLVALLGLRPGQRWRREALASTFWPESSEEAARQSLRMAWSDIRSTLGAHATTSDREWIQVDSSVLSSDACDFEAILHHQGDDRTADLSRAMSLVAGPFLPDLDDSWVLPEKLRLEDAAALAAVELIERLASAGEYPHAVDLGRRMLGVLGCREDLHIALIRAHSAQGMGSHALAQFEELESALLEAWGEAPSQAALDALEAVPRPPAAKSNVRANTLPRNPRRLIGRQHLLDELSSRMASEAGVTTLIGPGGSGKTSIAVEVARTLAEDPAQTAWFVSLASEATLEGAARRIQLELGLPPTEQSEAIPAIGRRLSMFGARSLLVLDNCEQLLDDAGELVMRMAADSTETRILVTSRRALNVREEVRVLVDPFDAPKDGLTFEETCAHPAVQLFEREARLANPRFEMTPDNLRSVVELCRRLDGLPLAIVLAAARTAIYSPAQIVSQISRSLDTLAIASAPDDERHAGLWQSISWSLGLLDEETRQLFFCLSMPSGRFSGETAEAISDLGGRPARLKELVDASLINSDPRGDKTEFWLFETLRRYALASLLSSEHFSKTASRFLIHLLDRARSVVADPDLSGREAVQQLYADSEDYLFALECALLDEDLENAAELTLLLVDMVSIYPLAERMIKISERVFHQSEGKVSPNLRARVGAVQVRIMANISDAHDQLRRAEEIEPLAADHPPTLARIRLAKNNALKALGRYEEAMSALELAREDAEQDDFVFQAKISYNMGLTSYCMGQSKESLAYLERAIVEAREGDDPDLLVRILFDLGAELAAQDRALESLPLFDEAIALSRDLGSRKLEGLTRWQQGDALLSMGRAADALRSLSASCELLVEAGFEAGLKWVFLKTGESLANLGKDELAVRVLGKAVESRLAESRPLAVYEERDLNKVVPLLKARLGGNYDHLWRDGAQTDWATLRAMIAKET